MKKIKYLLFSLLIGIIMIPIVMAENTVEITDIELDSKSDNVTIKNEPTFSGLEMNYDIRFLEVGNFVKYKVTIKNNTNNDFTIQEEETFSESEYIKYSFDASGVLKANSSMDVYVTITYNKEINSDNYNEGLYKESNKASIKLLNEEKEVVNPNTSSSIIGFIVLIVSGFLLICLILYGRKHGFVNAFIIVIFSLVCLPFIVKALEELKISVSVQVEVPNKYAVIYYPHKRKVFTEEEISQIGEENLYCDSYTYYIGEVSPENKRRICSGNFAEETRYYSFGEEVEVETVTYEEEMPSSCDLVQNYVYLCSTTIETMEYSSSYWGVSLLSEDGLLESSYAAGDTFIMPNHDVIFYEMVSF